jgi:uncharacterized SAM-binding protein YcdF (DUF218 family)
MVALAALFTTLILSPLVFVLLGAVVVLLLGIDKRRAAIWLLSATLLVLLVFSTGPFGNLVMKPLESRYPPFPIDPPPVGAIVVLGGGVIDGAPDEGGSAALSDQALKRVMYGLRLYRGLGVPIVVSGGKVWKNIGETEADTAAAVLARLGVPEGIVVREGRSRTTWENAREVAKILAQRGITRVALVTSAYHMPRAMLAFSRAGIACVPAPTDYRVSTAHMNLTDALPSFSSLGTSFTSLREYVGIAQYRVRR